VTLVNLERVKMKATKNKRILNITEFELDVKGRATNGEWTVCAATAGAKALVLERVKLLKV
jgi:predicted protein tyrosine phosphatase